MSKIASRESNVIGFNMNQPKAMQGFLRYTDYRLWPAIASPSSMTVEQAEIIKNIEQIFICDNTFFNSPEGLKRHIITIHNQGTTNRMTRQ
jgi:hypothetical protein